MSQETQTALAAVAQMRNDMEVALHQLAADGNKEALARSLQARLRMNEAAMLLGLASGASHPMHPNTKELGLSIGTADRAARVLLDGDVDYGDLSAEQIDLVTQKLTLAENAFQQFRVSSVLALMHLSDAFAAYEHAHVIGRAEPTEGTPA